VTRTVMAGTRPRPGAAVAIGRVGAGSRNYAGTRPEGARDLRHEPVCTELP
jgi:hypothetical protein